MTIRMKISLSALFLLPGLIPLYASEHSKAAVAAVERAAASSPKWGELTKLLSATGPYSIRSAGELTGTSKDGAPVTQVTVVMNLNYHKELVDNVLYSQTVAQHLNGSGIATTQAGNRLTSVLYFTGSGAALKSVSRAEFNDTMFVMQPVTERRTTIRQVPIIESLEFEEFTIVRPESWKKAGAKPGETNELSVKIHIKTKQTKQKIHLGSAVLSLAGTASPDVRIEFKETTDIKLEKIGTSAEKGVKIPLNSPVTLRFGVKIAEKLTLADPVFMLSFPLYVDAKPQVPLQEAVAFEKKPDNTLVIAAAGGGVLLLIIVFLIVRMRKTAKGGAPRPKTYMLKAESGALTGYSIELTRGEYTIGRDVDPGDGIKFPDDDKFVSKKHALLQKTATGYDIIDLQSTNGVYVNGNKVPRASLKQNDVIEFGDIKIRYRVIE